MPVSLTLKTPHWTLYISACNLEDKLQRLQLTMAKRGKPMPITKLYFLPAIAVESLEILDSDITVAAKTVDTIELPQVLFFENTLYSIEFEFEAGVESPTLHHDLNAVNQSFDYVVRRNTRMLKGHINFANQVGRFELPLQYYWQHKHQQVTVGFDVWPVKMDMAGDLARMYQSIDSHYPLWRYRLVGKTRQSFSRLENSETPWSTTLPILWLAQFESLRNALESAVRQIIKSPHSRMVRQQQMAAPHRIKGRVSHQLAERLMEQQLAGKADKPLPTVIQTLTADNAENRFIKMVLQECVDNLHRFCEQARQQDKRLGKGQKLSLAFYQKLDTWSIGLKQLLGHPHFKSVDVLKERLEPTSLLLRKAGFAEVYRIWQLLRQDLDILGSEVQIAVKNVAELYEVWCFLYIKSCLEDLGFKQMSEFHRKTSSPMAESVEVLHGVFRFVRDDGIKLTLAHKPIFNEQSEPVKACLTEQQPDIWLNALFPNGESLNWLFDAKYRIGKSDKLGTQDEAPAEAINQMYRYAHALVHMKRQEHRTVKSRPVIGAYVLYPGLVSAQFDHNIERNCYFESTREFGIGAFPLLPEAQVSDSENLWFKTFMRQTLGTERDVDSHLVAGASRIAPTLMNVRRYKDLCLVATCAEDERAPGYYEAFNDGSARWFHMKLQATTRLDIADTIMREVAYCAIASALPGKVRKADWLWPVKSLSLVERRKITQVQGGKYSDTEQKYWLFELGRPIRLEQTLSGFAKGHHHMKLTAKAELEKQHEFARLDERYQFRTTT